MNYLFPWQCSLYLPEQWILAKYIRDEFKEQSQQSAYSQSTKTGALFKRLKDQEKYIFLSTHHVRETLNFCVRFQRRKFILNVNEGKLMYFIKYSDKTPKDTILIRVSNQFCTYSFHFTPLVN